MLDNINKIRVGATFHITRDELGRTSKKGAQEYAARCLAGRLSDLILNGCDIFETKEVEGGLQLRAECYVLTPDNFSKLVENIQRDLLRFSPAAMVGGIDSD